MSHCVARVGGAYRGAERVERDAVVHVLGLSDGMDEQTGREIPSDAHVVQVGRVERRAGHVQPLVVIDEIDLQVPTRRHLERGIHREPWALAHSDIIDAVTVHHVHLGIEPVGRLGEGVHFELGEREGTPGVGLIVTRR